MWRAPSCLDASLRSLLVLQSDIRCRGELCESRLGTVSRQYVHTMYVCDQSVQTRRAVMEKKVKTIILVTWYMDETIGRLHGIALSAIYRYRYHKYLSVYLSEEREGGQQQQTTTRLG